MIPGLLQALLEDAGPEKQVKYGTLDKGKTIKNDETFHEALLEAGKKLGIKPSTILDGEGKAHEIACALETKV